MSSSVQIAIRTIVVFLGALTTGALLVNWIGLGRAMARLSQRAYVELHRTTNHTFDPYMPIIAFGAIAGGIVLVATLGFASAAGRLALVGVLCYAAMIAIGLPTCVRINKTVVEKWSVENPPVDCTAVRARWLRFHVLRTIFSIPALVCYILSAQLAGRAAIT